MKRYILTAMLGGAVAFGIMGQSYRVVVTTKDGEKYEYETSDVRKITFQDAPEYIEAPYLYGGDYRTQKDVGIYSLRIATCPLDGWNEPAVVGGAEIALQLVGPLSGDAMNPELPEGYYRVGADFEKYNWIAAHSGLYVRTEEGADGVEATMFSDGTVDIRKNGINYNIKMEMMLLTGDAVNFEYDGPVPLELSALDTQDFDTDIDVAFSEGQVRFYGNWFYPFSSDLLLQLYTGTFDPDGRQTEGYWLNCPVYMPKIQNPEDPANQRLADGVYTMDALPRNDRTNLPFTYSPGAEVDLWGTIYPGGTYITYVDPAGRNKLAYISEGTMTVSDGGSKIVFDMKTTTEGVSFHAEFNGDLRIFDFCDNSGEFDMSGTITAPWALDLTQDQLGIVYPLGETIKPGLKSYEVQIVDEKFEKDDYVQLLLLSDGDTLADGTYTINNSLENFSGVEGFVNPGGELIYSWISNLADLAPDGSQNQIAPVRGGTVKITTLKKEDIEIPNLEQVTVKRIEVDVVDEKGNAITGTFEGTVMEFASENVDSEAAPARKSPLHIRK